MRIDDDSETDLFEKYNEDEIEITMNEIDKLISQISITEDGLRKRKNNSIYITSKGLDDIDDVIINLDIPNEYFVNKERRIMKNNTPQIVCYIINIFSCLMIITIKFIIYVLNKKE